MENKASPKCLLTFVPEELVEELENETIEVDLTLYEPDSHENSPAATYYKRQNKLGHKMYHLCPVHMEMMNQFHMQLIANWILQMILLPLSMRYFQISALEKNTLQKRKKKIGSAENRATDTNLPSTNRNNVYNALKTTLVDCTAVVANVLFPADPEQLQKTAAEATLSNLEKSKKKEAKPPRATRKKPFDETRNKFTDFISNLTNSSIAKRAANALIQACLPDEGIITQTRTRKKAKQDIETLKKFGTLEQTHHSGPLGAHMGEYKTLSHSLLFTWSQLLTDIKSMLQTCAHCQAYNSWRSCWLEVHFSWPVTSPFYIMHCDLWSPGQLSS
ncbi:predicted protein [Chaetoceros tenuissimus]|uniref:Integrase zinc-binding domain-containing protein n=1 Tax=Chaetoceros tenuissimus TaxID=426638 RepID=A0AAD3H3S0_9STRA|nr:predicted protein [Chaetoceros tenuissimus]